MTDRVRISVENHVAQVTLARPERHNALDLAMFKAIIDAGESLAERRDVRAVVLHGDGPSFCSGLDYPTIMASEEQAMAWLLGTSEGHGAANHAQTAALVWRDLPVPVIASLHGAVFGGGLQIAAGADIRIAVAVARLSIMEAKNGLVPDMGITTAYANQVALDTLKELAFTGRVISGEEAHTLGLVGRVAADPLAAARELAADIAARSPDAIRATKALFDNAWAQGRDKALQHEAALQRKMFTTRNQAEAVTAAQEKRAPVFGEPES